MANAPTVIAIRITRELAHEQVLKLQCEYHAAMVVLFTALRFNRWRGAHGALRAARVALNTKAQLRRIARWL